MKTGDKLILNALIDIEETMIRLKIKQSTTKIKLQLLSSFRPNASLRQINNTRKINFR